MNEDQPISRAGQELARQDIELAEMRIRLARAEAALVRAVGAELAGKLMAEDSVPDFMDAEIKQLKTALVNQYLPDPYNPDCTHMTAIFEANGLAERRGVQFDDMRKALVVAREALEPLAKRSRAYGLRRDELCQISAEHFFKAAEAVVTIDAATKAS